MRPSAGDGAEGYATAYIRHNGNRERNLRFASKPGGTLARAMRVSVAVALAGLALAGCGSERQDEDEPEGEFTLEVVEASFPARQTTAQHSTMRLAVRNTDDRNLPNLAVTIDTEVPGGGDPAGAFATSSTDPRLADPERPVWIVDRGPAGGDAAATNTWALGPIFPGQTREIEWRLTAVRPGNYTVNYSVSPGLDGKAVAANGQRTTGSFRVRISDEPVPARVNDRGEVVREEAGRGRAGD
jgi:hypothetical protein